MPWEAAQCRSGFVRANDSGRKTRRIVHGWLRRKPIARRIRSRFSPIRLVRYFGQKIEGPKYRHRQKGQERR